LRTDEQKIPTRNHTRNAHTRKKSAVTNVDNAFPIADLIPVPSESPNALMNAGELSSPSSSLSSNSRSFIFLASSKSCSNEDISGDGEEAVDAAGDDVDAGVVEAEVAACGGRAADGVEATGEESLLEVFPVTTSRTFLTWSWTGVSSLGFSSMVGLATATAGPGGAAVEGSSGGEDEASVVDDDVADDAVGSLRLLRRFFCCCGGASSLLLLAPDHNMVWDLLPEILLLTPACWRSATGRSLVEEVVGRRSLADIPLPLLLKKTGENALVIIVDDPHNTDKPRMRPMDVDSGVFIFNLLLLQYCC